MIAMLSLFAPVLIAHLVSALSPGPSTIAIMRESMAFGRAAGLRLAAGCVAGSWFWSGLAALGLGTTLATLPNLLDALRVVAGLYLASLAVSALRTARAQSAPLDCRPAHHTDRGCFMRGLLIHTTNPKPILFFSALFAIGMPDSLEGPEPVVLLAAIWLQSLIVFPGFAALMGARLARLFYNRVRTALEIVFATVFGATSLALLVTGARSLARGY